MIVDAHHHFWDPAAAEYPWLTDELAVIRRPFGPEDLAPELAAAGVEATILVQTRSSLDESREFLALAGSSSFVRGVIGWVDLTDPGVADVLAELRAGPGGERLVGIRHQVHDEPDAAWLTRSDVRRGIRAVGAAGLAYDLLVRARELPAALELGRSLTDVRFVVDHLAKPPIAARVGRAVVDAHRRVRVARQCGLQGLRVGDGGRLGDVARPGSPARTSNGPSRCSEGRLLFGSDWPVCLLAAGYGEVLDAARQVTDGLSPNERAAVFAGNAVATYRL